MARVEQPLPIEQIVTLLAAAPAQIEALTDAMTPDDLRTPPAPGEWSAIEVLAHMRSCADVWGDCIATILAQDHPTLRAINPTTWIKRTDYPQQEFRSSLSAFTSQRAGLLAVLEPLPPEAWARTATVTGAGSALQRTARSYAAWMARHERPHLKQIERLAKTVRS